MKPSKSISNCLSLLFSMLLFNACENSPAPEEKLLIANRYIGEYQRLYDIEKKTLQGYNSAYDSLMIFFGTSEDSSFRNLSQPVLRVVSNEIKKHAYARDTLHNKIIEYRFSIQQYEGEQRQPIELKEP